jgi:hypothetical protein
VLLTSAAANYRTVCRAYTGPLFISKLAIVDEEADESEFWFRIIRKTELQSSVAVSTLEQEAHELASIFSVSLRTARKNHRRRREKENSRHSQTRYSANLPISQWSFIPQRLHGIHPGSAMRGQQPRTKCDQDERNGSGHENQRIACGHLE